MWILFGVFYDKKPMQIPFVLLHCNSRVSVKYKNWLAQFVYYNPDIFGRKIMHTKNMTSASFQFSEIQEQ